MGGKRLMSDDVVDQAAELREAGWSVPRIARKFGFARSTIYIRLMAAGAEHPRLEAVPLPQIRNGPRAVMRSGSVVRRFSRKEDALITSLDMQGVNASEIGRRLKPARRPNVIRYRLLTLARHQARLEAAQAATPRNATFASQPVSA